MTITPKHPGSTVPEWYRSSNINNNNNSYKNNAHLERCSQYQFVYILFSIWLFGLKIEISAIGNR